MKTAIMTDTNSGLSVADGERYGVFVLPMPVILMGRDYMEGVNITQKDLYQAMKENQECSTSQPSPGSVMGLWEKVLAKGYDEVVYLPMSSGLSCSCQTAKSLAENYDGKVFVADNHRISVTLVEAVCDAKYYADQGMDGAEIVKRLEEEAYESSIYIAVDTLKYLKKSGRVTASAAAIATALNIKPLLTIQGGKLDAFAKLRGMKACKRRIIEALKKDLEDRFSKVPEEQIHIATAGTFELKEESEEWRKQVEEAFPGKEVIYQELSCSIACHVGANSVAAAISKVSAPRAVWH